MGDEDVPDDVEVIHTACLEKAKADAARAERERCAARAESAVTVGMARLIVTSGVKASMHPGEIARSVLEAVAMLLREPGPGEAGHPGPQAGSKGEDGP